MSKKDKPSAEDAYADISQPPPHSPRDGKSEKGKGRNSFVLMYGFAELHAYLYEHGALIALSLLYALQRHLDMAEGGGEKAVALTAEVWKDAGIPPEEKSTRQTILEHLRQMPELVVLREKRTFEYRYCVSRGRLWRRMEKTNGKGNKE